MVKRQRVRDRLKKKLESPTVSFKEWMFRRRAQSTDN